MKSKNIGLIIILYMANEKIAPPSFMNNDFLIKNQPYGFIEFWLEIATLCTMLCQELFETC